MIEKLIQLKKDIKEYLIKSGFEVSADSEYWLNHPDGSRYFKKGETTIMNCPYPCRTVRINSPSGMKAWQQSLSDEGIYDEIINYIENIHL